MTMIYRVQLGCSDIRQVDVFLPEGATEAAICNAATEKARGTFGDYDEIQVLEYEPVTVIGGG